MVDLIHWIDQNAKGLALLVSAGAFLWSLKEWKQAQQWKRSERLDAFITQFSTDNLIRLATQVLDWSDRRVKVSPDEVITFRNKEVVESLRIHDSDGRITFLPPRDRIRDAIDALLSFFERLESAIDSKLIDKGPAIKYFGYWLERLSLMDRHTEESNSGQPIHEAQWRMHEYIRSYGSPDSIAHLFDLAIASDFSPIPLMSKSQIEECTSLLKS